MVKKVVKVEDKVSLCFCTTTRQMYQHCYKDSRLAHNITAKASTPSSSMKEPRVKNIRCRLKKQLFLSVLIPLKSLRKLRKRRKRAGKTKIGIKKTLFQLLISTELIFWQDKTGIGVKHLN